MPQGVPETYEDYTTITIKTHNHHINFTLNPNGKTNFNWTSVFSFKLSMLQRFHGSSLVIFLLAKKTI
jgi:hypothetical protein